MLFQWLYDERLQHTESKDEGISNKFINALDNFTKANPNGIKTQRNCFSKTKS